MGKVATSQTHGQAEHPKGIAAIAPKTKKQRLQEVARWRDARHDGSGDRLASLWVLAELGGSRADGHDDALRRVDDCGEQVDAKHAQVGNGERATLVLLRCQRSSLANRATGDARTRRE